MNVIVQSDGIRVEGLAELGAANARAVRDAVLRELSAARRGVELDMGGVVFVDSAGLGALLSIHREATRWGGGVRLLSPRPGVMQLLELTRIHLLLEIVPAGCRVTLLADTPAATRAPAVEENPGQVAPEWTPETRGTAASRPAGTR